MAKALVFWVFALNLAQAQLFSVRWCSGSAMAKQDLVNALNQLPDKGDARLINQAFAQWARKYAPANPSRILAVAQRGKQYYRWPQVTTPYTERTGVLGTRSLSRPTIDEIACFFEDTLVVVDTLRFFTGRSANVRFSLKIGQQEYRLPYDAATGEVLICTAALPGVPVGQYQAASMWIGVNKDEQEQAKGYLYFFHRVEKQALIDALQNQRALTPACDDLLYEASALFYSFWGGKQCANSNPYDYAQYEVLRRLTGCLK